MRFTVTLLALVLAGCATGPGDNPAPPPAAEVQTVSCPAAPIVDEECKDSPEGDPPSLTNLEDAYDDLKVSNSSCYAIARELNAEILRCREQAKRETEDGE